jgi:hypothetical protein
VDEFERAFLRCRSDDSTSVLSPLRHLSLIPGPSPVVGMMQSTELDDMVEYPLDLVEGAFARIPTIERTILDDPPGVVFFELRRASRKVLVELDPRDDPASKLWLGSPLETDCLFSDLLEVWRDVCATCPATWLHNAECTMWSPEAFVDQVAIPALLPALNNPNAPIRARAARERERYDHLLREIRGS